MSSDALEPVLVAGAAGMVGSAVCRALAAAGIEHIAATRQAVDLTRQHDVAVYLAGTRPASVVLAAARVGGIHANDTFPADFIAENLMIQSNVLQSAFDCGVTRLVFLGSSCIYPKLAAQPIEESALLTGPLEPTNEAYAIAKIAGIKMCESFNRQHGTDYRSLMPTNLYGPGDNFHPEHSHVIPALMQRIHDAKEAGAASVVIWGSGAPMREFLHVDDLARAICHVLTVPATRYWADVPARESHVNVGTGVDVSIRELAELLAAVVGFDGDLVFDPSKPDGTPRKVLNVERIHALGWRASIDFMTGLEETYRWYVANRASART